MEDCLQSQMGEEWDASLQSKEQIEASMLHKYEAAMRRERALAYSYTHQVLTKSHSPSQVEKNSKICQNSQVAPSFLLSLICI